MNEKHYVFTPDLNKEYMEIVGCDGIYLTDSEGNRYMDMCGGPFAVSLGYGRKDIAEALRDQAEKLHFAYRTYSLNSATQQAAECLNDVTGYEKFLINSGGTEANENAAKIARIYQLAKGNKSKHKVLGRWLSYHGGSIYTISIAADLSLRARYDHEILENGHIPPPYCYRCWYKDHPECCKLQCAEALETEILKQGPDTVAAFIMELVGGSGLVGAFPENKSYFKRIREICDKYDVLLIVDEVITGSGRCGTFIASEQTGMKPDIITMAKGISSAYVPASVVCCSKNVVKTIADAYKGDVFPLSFTSTNQPMQARAITETIKIIEKENLLNNAREMGEFLALKLRDLASRHNIIGDVRHFGGLLIALEFVADKQTKALLPMEMGFAKTLEANARKNGIIAIHFAQKRVANDIKNELYNGRYDDLDFKDAVRGDSVLLGPPLIITKDQITEFVEKYEAALLQTEKQFQLV